MYWDVFVFGVWAHKGRDLPILTTLLPTSRINIYCSLVLEGTMVSAASIASIYAAGLPNQRKEVHI